MYFKFFISKSWGKRAARNEKGVFGGAHLINQTDQGNHEHTKLQEFSVSNHCDHPLSLEGQGARSVTPCERGLTAYRLGSTRRRSTENIITHIFAKSNKK